MSDNSILPVWTEQYRVRHTEVTREGFLRADVFFDYMQEAAANHAKHIGVGLEALNSVGLMWVLSRLKLQVLHTPLLGETVSVTTWPSGIERLFATREFILKNEKEEIVARASSCWILLDQARMHPRKVLETLPAKLPDNSARERNFTNLDKLTRLPVSNPSRMRIPESMIDVNRHMNNARYVTGVFDWLAETRPGPCRNPDRHPPLERTVPGIWPSGIPVDGIFTARFQRTSEKKLFSALHFPFAWYIIVYGILLQSRRNSEESAKIQVKHL